MRISPSLQATVSRISITSRKSFEILDKTPSTVFQYFYDLQLKSLVSKCPSVDLVEFSSANNSFRRQVRKEWESLSTSRKRVYNALYFHFVGLDYRNMSLEEVAKRLEFPIPVSSEYLLFRNKFKLHFDNIWNEKRKQDLSPATRKIYLRSTSSGMVNVTRVIKTNSPENLHNLTKRFQEMCRECRKVWREKVTEEQKEDIVLKLKASRLKFERAVQGELAILDDLQGLLRRSLKGKVAGSYDALDCERLTSRTQRGRMMKLITGEKKS